MYFSVLSEEKEKKKKEVLADLQFLASVKNIGNRAHVAHP
jgi:hypothetical protein